MDFNNRILMVTGRKSSFGNNTLSRLLISDKDEIRILPRDEKKQEDMCKLYNNHKINCYIGYVHDYSSIQGTFIGVDFVFDDATLKQDSSCEFYLVEVVKTNVLGSDNVINGFVKNSTENSIFLSTDKSAYPINSMLGLKKNRFLNGLEVLENREKNTLILFEDYNVQSVSDKVLRTLLSYTNYVNRVVWGK
jgi:FlaA1/EpsC-like NDP-sugar epimerase